jgi:hypothetical protein
LRQFGQVRLPALDRLEGVLFHAARRNWRYYMRNCSGMQGIYVKICTTN